MKMLEGPQHRARAFGQLLVEFGRRRVHREGQDLLHGLALLVEQGRVEPAAQLVPGVDVVGGEGLTVFILAAQSLGLVGPPAVLTSRRAVALAAGHGGGVQIVLFDVFALFFFIQRGAADTGVGGLHRRHLGGLQRVLLGLSEEQGRADQQVPSSLHIRRLPPQQRAGLAGRPHRVAEVRLAPEPGRRLLQAGRQLALGAQGCLHREAALGLLVGLGHHLAHPLGHLIADAALRLVLHAAVDALAQHGGELAGGHLDIGGRLQLFGAGLPAQRHHPLGEGLGGRLVGAKDRPGFGGVVEDPALLVARRGARLERPLLFRG